MPGTADAIDLAPILALPPAERRKVADAIYDSIPEAELPPRELPEEVKRMIDQRLQDYHDNPDDVVSWEEIKRDALARARRPA